MTQKRIDVEGWPRPKGYSNGIVCTGPTLYVAGQVGWNTNGEFAKGDFVAQFDQTLANVMAIVTQAGGTAASIVKMTIYVTDLEAYRNSTTAIGAVWRERLGKVFPAMALVGVAGLVERDALVEIEVTALLA